MTANTLSSTSQVGGAGQSAITLARKWRLDSGICVVCVAQVAPNAVSGAFQVGLGKNVERTPRKAGSTSTRNNFRRPPQVANWPQ
jgi:hypothetical protein